jgi:hypothetical protein
MNKPKLITYLSLLFVVLISACGSAAPVATTPALEPVKFPTGKFISVSNNIQEVEYRTDNTWSYYLGGLMSAKGTYKVDGNLWIEQGTKECPFPGTYLWSYDGKTLSFKLQGEDKCDPRRQATDGQSFTLVN